MSVIVYVAHAHHAKKFARGNKGQQNGTARQQLRLQQLLLLQLTDTAWQHVERVTIISGCIAAYCASSLDMSLCYVLLCTSSEGTLKRDGSALNSLTRMQRPIKVAMLQCCTVGVNCTLHAAQVSRATACVVMFRTNAQLHLKGNINRGRHYSVLFPDLW